MNPVTRYFTDELAVWKFEPGHPPKMKTAICADWIDSDFESLEEFLRDPTGLMETSEEGAARHLASLLQRAFSRGLDMAAIF